MDFALGPELEELAAVARRFLAERVSSDAARRALDEPPWALPDLQPELAGMGWLGIASPEDVGGGGAGLAAAAVLAAEAGRALLPGPFLPCLAAGIIVDRLGDDELRKQLLPDLFAGQRPATVALEEPTRGFSLDSLRTRAVGRGGGFVLDGVKILVADGDGADLLVVADHDGAPAWFLVEAGSPGVVVEPMRRLDGQAAAEVCLEGVAVPPERVLSLARPGAADFGADVWTLLLAADLLGTAERLLEMTRDYARARVQFGRPIGTFQAVSHPLADIYVDVELGRSLLYGACLALDEGSPDAGALVSAAKAWTGDAAVRAAERGLQIHGGIGFTWEHDLHLYLRRARCHAAAAGDAGRHLDRIAAHLGLT
jgi:alkylation response protein AidB-like acyl-CoA dehydrogenase